MAEGQQIDPRIETYRNQVEQWRTEIQHRADWQVESSKSTIQFALAAIRGIVLINGGAAIAILAFLGNIWAKDDATAHAAARAMVAPLGNFLAGVAMGVACAAVSYLAQFFFSSFRNKIGVPFQLVAIALGAGGVATFIVGTLQAVDVFGQTFGR